MAFAPAALVALITLLAFGPGAIAAQRTATTAGAAGMKAVIIVGPGDYLTRDYLTAARLFAKQAQAVGMDVRTIFTPHATWPRVRDAIQRANLVVYYGHGNGWPSPYAPFQERTKDGFGLNPSDGSGLESPVSYHGAEYIRKDVHFAPNAIVVLLHLCYASGNAEANDRPMWASSASDRNLAVERVDNYAAGFLKAGAGVVFTFNWNQIYNLAKEFATSHKTMDEIFMTRDPQRYGPQAFIGTYDYYRESRRTPGARIHLDPDNTWGHRRAITGDLTMTAQEWRGQASTPDTQAPSMSDLASRVGGVKVPADAPHPQTFSPNGDHFQDILDIDHRLSEPATIHVEVRDASSKVVRTFHHWAWQGRGVTRWDGRDDGGGRVPSGIYHLTLTPTDQAGNQGASRIIDARVLTTLASSVASRRAIDVRDGDALATHTTLSARLTTDATVTWRVVDGAGNVVRTRLHGEAMTAGRMSWEWDGTDQDGNAVPDGEYHGALSATTEAGTVTYRRTVWVGPWRMHLSDRTPRRGGRLSVTVTATEPQASAPRLLLTRPGVPTRTLRMVDSGPRRWHVSLRLGTGGTSGKLQITVSGRDRGGQVESYTQSVHVS